MSVIRMVTLLDILPIVELTLSIFICCLVLFLLLLILITPLHYGFKSLLFLNTFALLTADLVQTVMEMWIVINGRYPTVNDDLINWLILLHSFGFYMCTLTFMLMIIERFILCTNPFFYEDKHCNFPLFLFLVSIVSFPFVGCLVMMLQNDIVKMASSLLLALIEGSAVVMLIVCHRKSQEYYSTRFIVVPLNVRYQASKVIELTHALIPICYIGFMVKIGVFLVYFVSHNTDSTTSARCQIALRMICSAYSLLEPIILISRVKMLRRRFSLLIGRKKVIPISYTPTDNSTKPYFDALRDQWE